MPPRLCDDGSVPVKFENEDSPCCPDYKCPCDDTICTSMVWCGENVLPVKFENDDDPCCPLYRCPEGSSPVFMFSFFGEDQISCALPHTIRKVGYFLFQAS